MEFHPYNRKKELTPAPCFKAICVGRNYLKHIHELQNRVPKNPVFFLKPATALTSTPRTFPPYQMEYEGEITFLIENRQMVGVAYGVDLTLRDLQTHLKEKGLPWERAKAFKGSLLLSQFVPISPEIIPTLQLKTYIDGELRQKGGVEEMIFSPIQLLEEAEKFFGLEDGDILMTGTPAGVGEVKPGTHLRGEIWSGERLLITGEWRFEEEGKGE